MSGKIRQIPQINYPESYDLLCGTPDVETIFCEINRLTNKRELPVYTSRVSEVIPRGNYWLKHVRYPLFAVEMILEGEMEFLAGGQRRIAGPGFLYLIPPGTIVRFTAHHGRDVRKLCAILGGENLRILLRTLKLSDSRLVRPPDPGVIETMLRELKAAVTASGIENSARSYRFLLELGALIGEESSAQMPLARAVSILDADFREILQIPEVAARAGVSESTLRRLFKAELHCSPLEYLNSVRLKSAAQKLRSTRLQIKEIAQMSGFLSPAHFCTQFRGKYGMSPGQFRQKAKTDAAQAPAPAEPAVRRPE